MRHHSPLLLVFKGHPGSGKSAVARALGRVLHVPVIDKDDVKDVIGEACDDPGGLAYTVMFNIARRQLVQGLSVICDSPLSEAAGYTAACCIAHDTSARIVIIECFCSSEAEWRRRIEQRSSLHLPSHHVTTWNALEDHLHRRETSSSYLIAERHVKVDTIEPLEKVLTQITSWLREQHLIPAGERAEHLI